MDNKMKIVNALLKRADTHQKEVLLRSFEYISYTHIVCIALDLGLDTDAILAQETVLS